jgi:hypothetical protein
MSRGGAHLPDPTISVDGINGTLNTGSMTTHTNDQCFIDGLDTVQVVLYNAPYTKEKHQLVVTLNPNLIARTEPFVLLPGPLDSLVITDANFLPISDRSTGLPYFQNHYGLFDWLYRLGT